MRILFVDFTENIYDKNAIYSISSVLKKNDYFVKYINHKSIEQSTVFFKNYNPDLVLYSCFSSHIANAINFDFEMKKQFKFHSLIGGPGPTFDHVMLTTSTINAYCMGEGEFAIIEYIKSGFIPNLNIKNKEDFSESKKHYPFPDLNSLPFPDRSVIYEVDSFLKNMPSKQFMAGRGCPYHCTYCHNHIIMEEFKDSGPKFRYKSVDYLIAEIKDVKANYPLENIVFQDDVFVLDKKWLREFCEKFPREVNLPFTCNIRANLINDEIALLLKSAGCAGACWSIESGNDHIRNKILLRNMSKRVILNASNILNKHSIRHRTGNVIGIPGETFEQMLETLELNIEVKPYLAFAYTFVPFPGLALTEYAINNGYLNIQDSEFIPRTFFKPSILKIDQELKDKISKLALLFPTIVKFPFLYYQKPLFEFLMDLPIGLLRCSYHFTNIYYTSKMFKVKIAHSQKITGFLRYLDSEM